MPDETCKSCGHSAFYNNIMGETIKEKCVKCKEPIVVHYVSSKGMEETDWFCEKCGKDISSFYIPRKSYTQVRQGSHGSSKRFFKRDPLFEKAYCEECSKEMEKDETEHGEREPSLYRISPEQKQEVLDMRATGMKPSEIAEHLGWTSKKVRRIIRNEKELIENSSGE